MDKKHYLKPNLVIEPLIDKWYAWSHLVSPATASLNILERHIKIMESFLSAPDIHVEAVKNPKLKGGPFMDLCLTDTGAVRKLLDATVSEHSDLLEFANSIKYLDKLLREEASGLGLEKLYEKVPSNLRGYVELFYDRNNNAGFRFFETLLYRSKFYKQDLQSIALWITDNDHRPFCLSTPKLDSPEVLFLNIPFAHKALDELAIMKRTPGSVEQVMRNLGVEMEQEGLFRSFFTEQAPPNYSRYSGDRIRMRYFGHACILVETKDVSILLDPVVSYYGYDSSIEHFSDIDLPDSIDYVLITHNHQDHILFETLLPLRHKIKNIIVPATNSGRLEDPDLREMFRSIGFDNVISVSDMEIIQFSDLSIQAIPFIGEHSDLNILTKSCFLARIGEFKLLFLADSRIMEPRLYEHIKEEIGKVDVLFLGMECDGAPLSWLYGPLMSKKLTREQDGSRRLAGSDCQRGLALVDIFQPREVYVYAMGMEPWLEFISSIKYTDESNPIVQSNKLISECETRGIIAERLYGEKELLYDKS